MSGLSDLRDRVLNLLATGNSFRPTAMQPRLTMSA
jgi:hypothetical protein